MKLAIHAPRFTTVTPPATKANTSTTNLLEVLTKVVEKVSPARLVLIVDMRSRDACVVRGDAALWEHALADVVRNASVVSGERGEVQIVVHSVEAQLRLTVTDTGCGIAAEDLPIVAAGLALERVREAAAAAGGRIAVWSRGEGMGSSVQLRLPMAAETRECARRCPAA
jgi:signal transduction histidine kinase